MFPITSYTFAALRLRFLPTKNGNPNPNFFETPNSITTTSGSRTFNLRDFWVPQTWRRVFFGGVFLGMKKPQENGWMWICVCFPLFSQTTIMVGDLDNEQLFGLFWMLRNCGTFETPSFKKKWTHFVWEKQLLKLHQNHREKMHNL